ncbi:stage VI sporulation protein D [Bacillus sp. V3-13]|uniref:stage VI sporulation protein D n=1 Tax=Bacillus sp. V3-13 TaxID=2053728 RepID=UPI000C759D5C|nr:stage VI sporulation protein D [Bacillus sp. V3-13]PLR75489.1 stage VI sporulation protein D [Bacillus sp. V3-13]
MSQGNQSFLRFSLEESLWFQKGQEVAELISVSLDPNITIQENEQYVTIRGSLELSGEYKKHEEAAADNGDEITGAKFVHGIEEREEGICEFIHRFPVDITIPNNRIQSVFDIDIQVDSFDYLFPERSCMKLTADLTISGLYGEQQTSPVEEEIDTEYEVLRPVPYPFFPHADTKQSQPVFAEQESGLLPEAKLERPDVTQQSEPGRKKLEPVREAKAAEEKQEPVLRFASDPADDVKTAAEKEEADLYEPFEAEARKQPETAAVQEMEQPAAEKTGESPQVEKAPEISFSAQRSEYTAPSTEELAEYKETEEAGEAKEPENAQEAPPKQEEQAEATEEAEENETPEDSQVKKKKGSKKKSMSLTEFFARKEEEEELTKLKICIVQHGDTIDSLAERYDVSTGTLLRVNHLEANQDIYEGQVLYIPAAMAGKR